MAAATAGEGRAPKLNEKEEGVVELDVVERAGKENGLAELKEKEGAVGVVDARDTPLAGAVDSVVVVEAVLTVWDDGSGTGIGGNEAAGAETGGREAVELVVVVVPLVLVAVPKAVGANAHV